VYIKHENENHRVVIVILLSAASLVLLMRQQYEFPPAWNNVHTAMTRSQIVQAVGKPDYDCHWVGIKGCFLSRNTVTGWQELNISFDKNDRASDITVTRFLGTREHFMRQVARIEF
jgi:hypothetical protein